jgi:hypothetical protein
MKKYITPENILWTSAFMTFIFIASMLCAACVNLQQRINQKQELNKDVRVMFAQIEKPLK